MFSMLAATQTAEASTGSIGSLLVSMLPIVLMIVVFYFLIIRPQKKQRKKEEDMRNNVQVGDEIITIAGLYGRVVALKEDSFIVESGPDRAKQRVARWAIQQNLTVHEDQ